MTSRQRAHWLRQWAEEAKSLERRRSQRLAVAEAVAEELGARWPEVSIWLFGSTLGPGFHVDSDLDLAVAGLPAEALIDTLTVAEVCGVKQGLLDPVGRSIRHGSEAPLAPICGTQRAHGGETARGGQLLQGAGQGVTSLPAETTLSGQQTGTPLDSC